MLDCIQCNTVVKAGIREGASMLYHWHIANNQQIEGHWKELATHLLDFLSNTKEGRKKIKPGNWEFKSKTV